MVAAAGVYAGELDVFGDGVKLYVAVLRHGIHLYLFCSLYELRNHYGMLFGDVGGKARKRCNSSSLEQTFMAAPESTYEGRTSTGNPTSSTNMSMSSIDVTAPARLVNPY